ncbi:hypothetical protein ACUNWD_00510 [Sunxiuqinia sp. A32]|uniref:hypothetical protein n=1 Tax=Sunxiuqinia sp. A32 TaxID=3461496 RepID=UPI0040451D7A
MKNKIIKISIVLLIFSLFACDEEISNKMTMDYPLNYDIEYGIRQVLQYDPMNINGINVSDKLDFFSTIKFTLHYNDGKLTGLTYSNGDVPFSPFGFEGGEELDVDCELDYDVFPNELRILGTNQVVAYFQNGEFIMPFQLDCDLLSYKYTFKNIE